MSLLRQADDAAPDVGPDVMPPMLAGPTPGLMIWGFILTVIGLIIMALATWAYDPTVTSTGSYGLPDRIYNSGGLQTQMMAYVFGCSALVAGLVTVALGSAVGAIREAMAKN